GLGREDDWTAGASDSLPPGASPLLEGASSLLPAASVASNGARVGNGSAPKLSQPLAEALAKVREETDLDEDDVTVLFRARGCEFEAVCAAADELRRRICGDTVSYVVTRNINYTNVCYFRCGFCAFSKGKLAANLRGAPYLVPMDEIVRRCVEAWERGATEVCLQGGIHPAFTGDFYV